MTVTAKNIIPRKYAEIAQTSQYTAVNCRTIIDKFTVSNTTGTTAAFSVNLVASGDTVSGLNNTLPTINIAAYDVYECPELVGQIIEPSGFISTIAGTASALSISASGREIT